MARPKMRLKLYQGLPFFYFSLTFRTPSFGRPVRQFNCRTNDARTREVDKPRRFTESQVVSITSSIPVLHTIPQLAPGTDMLHSPTFCLSH